MTSFYYDSCISFITLSFIDDFSFVLKSKRFSSKRKQKKTTKPHIVIELIISNYWLVKFFPTFARWHDKKKSTKIRSLLMSYFKMFEKKNNKKNTDINIINFFPSPKICISYPENLPMKNEKYGNWWVR